MGGEFVAALRDEIFDHGRPPVGEQRLHFVGRDLVFAELLRQLENLAIVLVGFAHVVGVVQFHELAAVRFTFPDDFRFREIGFLSRLARNGFAVLVGLRRARREFPTDPLVGAHEEGIERPVLFRGETLDKIGLSFFD